MNNKTRIILADPSEEFRILMRQVMEQEGDFEVIGSTGSGAEAMELVASRQPDVLVTEVVLPELDGFALLRRVKELPHPPQVVVVSAFCSQRTVREAAELGVHFFLPKPCSEQSLLERIREIRASERRAYQKIADVFEQCSYDYDKNSDTTKAFYAFVQNKLHYAVTGKTAAELISERATLDSPTMGLTTWKGAPDGKILKSDTLVAKNYLNEKELSRLNRLVTMFIDYAELMAEDEQLMSMQDWLNETDRFLTNNRRKVLDGKGHISREAAAKKVGAIYDEFRKKQDAEYISEFDRQTEKYLKGE